MEFQSNCKTTVAAPSGWASITPMIRIKGERELSPKQRDELKSKLKKLTPSFHVCPKCIFGGWTADLTRLLPQSAEVVHA